MIQLLWMSVQTQHDTADTLAERELSETQTQELLPAGKGLHGAIASVHIDALLEGVSRQNTRELAEDVVTGVHAKNGEMWSDLPLPD